MTRERGFVRRGWRKSGIGRTFRSTLGGEMGLGFCRELLGRAGVVGWQCQRGGCEMVRGRGR